MSIRHFNIAGIILAIDISDTLLPALPESFRPFAIETGKADMTVRITSATPEPVGSLAVLDHTVSDLGDVTLFDAGSSGYLFRITTDRSGGQMQNPEDFSVVDIQIPPFSPDATAVINSLIRIAFSQRILLFGGISVHASSVCRSGRGTIFLGASGTGKSTHARLWTDTLSDTHLINDDNPILRIHPEGARVYGSPWSGKTPCYRAESHPLCAIIRLSQAPKNRLTPLSPFEAFTAILPSCSVIKTSPLLHSALIDTVETLAATIPTARLACRPDPAAARLAATL